MNKEFFWPALPSIDAPKPERKYIGKLGRRTERPDTPEIIQDRANRLARYHKNKLKWKANRVNKFTEQISLEQWQQGVDRTRVISRCGI